MSALGSVPARANVAIVFEPDAYRIDGSNKLMGRQSAGNGFLRAAVAGRLPNEVLWAYARDKKLADIFAGMVQKIDPNAPTGWAPSDRPELLGQIGTVYRPDPDISQLANLRLRADPRAWSAVGVTHTTASHSAMGAITGLLTGAVMPWDALICTSQAVRDTVQVLLDAQVDYLRWRVGAQRFTLPQLPVIPLGAHCNDFVQPPEARRIARAALRIADDEVVALFLGRLSFHAKAHPHAMYLGLETAARQSGQKTVLLQCGWFANPNIENSFKGGAAQFAPSVRCLWADGREAAARQQAWAAADLFISLVDNIQETFGLTPIEAMAAGLPVVITDWNGYKETVRDGIDGFRIATWMPPPPLGAAQALRHEAGVCNYDTYLGMISQHVAVDHRQLAERLTALLANPGLRHSLGAAGCLRARTEFDWSVVYSQYRALWDHLADIRAHSPEFLPYPHTGGVPQRMDPCRAFAAYASHAVLPHTGVARLPGAADWPVLRRHALFNYADALLPSPELAEALLAPLEGDKPLPVETLASEAGLPVEAALAAVVHLAKAGCVALGGQVA
jgi:glycosyltransferase involved in cell wall biosynthesis